MDAYIYIPFEFHVNLQQDNIIIEGGIFDDLDDIAEVRKAPIYTHSDYYMYCSNS